jgi:cation:H+ antiporter
MIEGERIVPTIVLSLLAGLALLTAGGEFLVRGSAALALRLGLTPLIVGLTVVAFGTSSPELAVSLDATVGGLGDVAVGNVVGSNICNVALILGLAALIRPMRIHAQLVRLDVPLMIAASAGVVALLADGMLGRGAGLVCVAMLVIWVGAGLRLARRESREVEVEFSDGIVPPRMRSWIYVLFVLGGLVALFAGGQLFVGGAVDLARTIGVSEAVIGLSIVAVGTSLPELATSLVGAVRGQGDIAVGNIVGSNIFNLLGILGLAAIVTPLEIVEIGWKDFSVMIAVAVLLLPMVRSGHTLSRVEGVLLLSVYVAYTVFLFVAPS